MGAEVKGRRHGGCGVNARRQQGVVLLIALIVLVALTLTGIRLMRSVGVSNLVSGNLAFKDATLASADHGIQAATLWIAGRTGMELSNDDGPKYQSSFPVLDPPWNEDATWPDGTYFSIAEDAAGNSVQYRIHRMCTLSAQPYDAPGNSCALRFKSAQIPDGASRKAGGMGFDTQPQIYYRVTVRVQGARGTQSVVQAFVSSTV